VPVITAPSAATVGVGQANAVSGIDLSESGATTGETFTVTLTDSNGTLSASDASGATVSGSGTSLQISGSLGQVNAALATLRDNDPTTPSDSITINAS